MRTKRFTNCIKRSELRIISGMLPSNWIGLADMPTELDDLILHLEAVPPEKWGTFEQERETCGRVKSVIGLLIPETIVSDKQAARLKLFQTAFAFGDTVELISDGRDDRFQQLSPKDRVISYLRYVAPKLTPVTQVTDVR